MSFTDIKRNEIKMYLLGKIDQDDDQLINKVADSFGISATSVKRYLESELKDSHICKDENRKCGYRFENQIYTFEYNVSDMNERDDTVLFDDILPLLNLNDNALNIWSYTLSEIFNNVIEHSEGDRCKVVVDINFLYTKISIIDNGIGIFKKIAESMNKFGFVNPTKEDAIKELYKGKFTSDPANHSGEGIFFSMKLLDKFSAISDGIVFKSGYLGDYTVINSHLLSYAMKFTNKGTVVVMRVDNDTKRNPVEVFDRFSDVEDGLTKTVIPVFNACNDHNPVSRSQAKRLCTRLDTFKEVIWDFTDCTIMAQGFADEVFRVYKNAHPDVIFTPINMNEAVKKMYLYNVNNKVSEIKY